MARHVLAILSAVHGAGRAHGALHPTAVEVEYEGSERVRLKVLPTCLLRFSRENLAPELQAAPPSRVPRGGGGDKTPLLQQPPSPGLGPGGGGHALGHPGGANSSTRWMLRRSGSASEALAGTRGSAASSAQKADMFAFGVLLHWMALPDAPAPVPGALALPPFLDGNLRCAPRVYPCSGAFASCAVCGGLLLWA